MGKSHELLINRINAFQKLIISLSFGVLCYFILPFGDIAPSYHVIASWDIFCICSLILTWITFFTTSSYAIRTQAKKQDDKRVVVFIIVLIAIAVSMLSTFQMLINGHPKDLNHILALLIEVSSMLLSWFLVHTVFAMRYAHIFYGDSEGDPKTHAGGLDFPGDRKPDFLDFAYYSFTLGMTFQVSDVEITSKTIRRLSLLHGLFSFGFNATIIAFAVNVIAGLIQK